MNNEFTLKTVVDFMEAHGFYVREAREIESEIIVEPFAEPKTPPGRTIEAIRLEISPKAKD